MDTEEFPPPPPEVLEREPKAVGTNDEEEDEGEQFDFDSGDEIPEADRQAFVPPPPEPGSNTEHHEANVTAKGADSLEKSEKLQASESTAEDTPRKVNPYSVINISPMQEKDPSSSPDPSPQDEPASPNTSSGYSVPVPCGYAVPSNLPLILPAYSSPVIIRSVSVDEEGMQSATEECHCNSLNSEEPQNR
ncbi:rho guanine nucleotide exchange factor 10-like isoform X2 [Meleagris gallopavo]|uniref:rho guanine nucleotide exchange factor 10-like isoform X2 n=1 Tax=Meleagris gallopavo TaxID=9103 RepID=UPI000549AE55|nr:rho guanine nucleotide exchange factor 10-like isoform X2 [Meleagris gallopavo]